MDFSNTEMSDDMAAKLDGHRDKFESVIGGMVTVALGSEDSITVLSLELNFERRRRMREESSLSADGLQLLEDGSQSHSEAFRTGTRKLGRLTRRLQGGATIDVGYEIRLRGENAEAMADAVAGNIEEVASDPEALAASVNRGVAESFALSEDQMQTM